MSGGGRGAKCPGCGAPRLPMAHCPQCGAIYEPEAAPASKIGVWRDHDDDGRLELRLRTIAPIVALALAWLAYSAELGRSIFRTFLSMWLHELGHAVTAWLSGFAALPGPWRTSIAESRSIVVTLLLFAAIASLGYRAFRARRFGVVAAAAAVAILQIVLTFGLRVPRAQAIVTFGGDGGGMILGTLLFASFYSAPGSYLHKSWLRWGFLVIGAFGFMDPFVQWWRARRDPDVIPFGEMEGVGLSDPSKLLDDYGWSEAQIVRRFVTLGALCLLVIVATYVHGIVAARRRVRAQTS